MDEGDKETAQVDWSGILSPSLQHLWKSGDSPNTLVLKVGPFISDQSRSRCQVSRRGAMVARRFPMNFIGEGCEFDPRRRYVFLSSSAVR